MLSEKMASAINDQINKEMYSGYLYMAMSAACTEMGMNGFAKWLMGQYHEEMFHAMKMYEYVVSQGAPVVLKAIEEPPRSFDSLLQMFQKVREHEQFVTSRINNLADIAQEEKDKATGIFLQWYVMEQVEEESNANELVAQLKVIDNNPNGLFMLDEKLGQRAVTVPTDFTVGVTAAAEKNG